MKQVSERALLARVNRRVSADNLTVKTCRIDSRWFGDLGRHYAVDSNNIIVAQRIDLDEWLSELGSIQS